MLKDFEIKSLICNWPVSLLYKTNTVNMHVYATSNVRVSMIEDQVESFEFQVTVNLHLTSTVTLNLKVEILEKNKNNV